MVKFVKLKAGTYLNVDHISNFKLWENYVMAEDKEGNEWVLKGRFPDKIEAQEWLDNFIEELEF